MVGQPEVEVQILVQVRHALVAGSDLRVFALGRRQQVKQAHRRDRQGRGRGQRYQSMVAFYRGCRPFPESYS